uniref:Uncharacterized protein n=1 Tax=Oryctolagus cuniculus TaxID=9986 RepID=A0A5F9DJF8_RABIT
MASMIRTGKPRMGCRHVKIPADAQVCGAVNNDLILFSMLVIYFRINILVYFCLMSVCFALLTTMRV